MEGEVVMPILTALQKEKAYSKLLWHRPLNP